MFFVFVFTLFPSWDPCIGSDWLIWLGMVNYLSISFQMSCFPILLMTLLAGMINESYWRVASVLILGLHSRDEADMLTVQNNGKMTLKFCIIIESNSQKTFFAIVLYTKMAAVTSGANQ